MKVSNRYLENFKSEWEYPWIVSRVMRAFLDSENLPKVVELGNAPLPTEFGDWTYYAFGDYTVNTYHEALVFGNSKNGAVGNGENLLCRLHSSCRTREVYRAINCECAEELHRSMKIIQKDGRGVILYLEQEGRGSGICGKMGQLNEMFGWVKGKIKQKTINGKRVDTDTAFRKAGFPSECRDFSIAGEILSLLGVKSVRLLSNNPAKIKGLESVGIKVVPVEIHIRPANGIVKSDLESKAKYLGHHIGEKHLKIQKR